MSKLDSIYLQGVRSYGPFDDDGQSVKFISPITLIMGQNGCGKTTIIEALKYATTGVTPPGSDKGKFFVHDPKLSKVSEVHSLIKLNFVDATQERWTVKRIMEGVQKANDLKFKTLDVTITRTDRNGEKKDYRHRCLEADHILCAALGVSKPILNNVIFCHQEDACWPLDEGKKLKEKFDDIFDVTKYNKCIESVLKLSKKTQDELKVSRETVKRYKILKDEADAKKSKLRDNEQQLVSILEVIQGYTDDLSKKNKRLAELNALEKEINKLLVQLENLRNKMDNVKQQQQDLRQNIKQEFQGSNEELLEAIEDFNSQLRDRENKLTNHERNLKKFLGEEAQLMKTINQKQVQKGRLETEEKQQQDTIKFCNSSLVKLAAELGIETPQQPDIIDVERVTGQVQRKVAIFKDELEATRVQLEREEQMFQTKIDGYREAVAKLNQETEMKRAQQMAKKSDERSAIRQISAMKVSNKDLEEVESSLDQVKMDLDVATSMHEMENWNEKIAELTEKRTRLEENLEVVDKRVHELQSHSNILAEIKILDRTISEKEEKIKELENTLKKPMMYLFKEFPTARIKQSLNQVLSQCENVIREKTKLQNARQQELTTLKLMYKQQEDKLASMEEEVRKNEESILEQCGSQDLETSLKTLESEIQELQDEKGVLSSSERMYRHYIEKMRQSEPCCPLCHRIFDSRSSVTELITELNDKASNVPTLVREKESHLNRLLSNQREMLQLKPAYQHCARLKTLEIPSARSELEEIYKKRERVQKQLEEVKGTLTELQTREKVAKGAQGDAVVVDQLQTEVEQVKEKKSRLEKSVQEGPAQNLQDVMEEQKHVRQELNASSKELEDTRCSFNSSKDEIHKLREKKNKLDNNQLKIKGELQARQQLEKKKVECEKEVKSLSMDITDLTEKLQPANKQLEIAVSEKRELQAANRIKIDNKRTEVTNFQKKVDDVIKLQTCIESYEKRGVAQNLEAVKESIQTLETDKKNLDLQKQQVCEEIDKVKTYLATQKIKERELGDNLKLREKRKEEKDLNLEIAALSEQIHRKNVKEIVKERKELVIAEQDLQKEKAFAEGSQKQLQNKVDELNTELEGDIYKNANKDYMETSIKITVLEYSAKDLFTYAKAMDWAVTHFHSTTKRRNYNYRVVQVKGGVEIDMRGRCSGGQKILASLLIRLALAETFSAKCAFFALDEPTANLDRENINSFACALKEVVKARNARGNFQLLIITHDHQFLETLHSLDLLEDYFDVSRDARPIESGRVALAHLVGRRGVV
uniref:(California timema) hypothetical protein n=1 Tax=Timema californicum TaxID=61474 RepID=A0A7R9J1I7_TIMCA|nr:unnamed protein product [Timema californicum]